MTTRTGSTRATLFDQVGGFDGVDRASTRLFERLGRDPLFSSIRADADARWQVQLLFTDLFGGPMAYDGPEPKAVAARLGLDGPKCGRLLAHVEAAYAEAGIEAQVAGRLRGQLEEFVAAQGLEPAPPGVAEVVAAGLREAARAPGPDANIFILDRNLTVVHVSDGAARRAQAADADLRRAFNLGAAELVGASILRFHSAPTTLQAVLADAARLPHDTTWSFGKVVWKAQFRAVYGPDGTLVGYVVLWRDETDAHHAQAVFQRLRNQSEDLPVPVMFPDPTGENWFGNAACEHALERLAPHLATAINPLLGVPIALFFPDAARRRAIFSDPAQLPHKEQIRIGPETIALLVTPVRDEAQRYLGPQITWEIVHFTPGRQGTGTPAMPSPSGAVPSAVPVPAALAASGALRTEARALAGVSGELQTLARLLEAAADHAEGHPHLDPGEPAEPVSEAVRLAEEAAATLEAVRGLQPPPVRREAAQHALATVAGIARRTARMTMDAALLVAQEDAALAAEALRQEAQALSQGLAERVQELSARAQTSCEVLRSAMEIAARVEQWRTRFDDGAP